MIIQRCLNFHRQVLPGFHRCTVRRMSSIKTVAMEEIDATSLDKHTLLPLLQPFVTSKQPVILRQALKASPALTRWKDWDYLEQTVKNSLCQVEIGGTSYSNADVSEIWWQDYIAYLRFFEERYGRYGGSPKRDELVYLAQNDLRPELQNDFEIPSFLSGLGEGKLYNVMMWIGPYGCRSPLHYDPLDNFLMQFVGEKKVLMLPPDANVYAGSRENQKNTSPFDFEQDNLDFTAYPLLSQLPPAVVGSLTEADILYIPKKWWHQVRTTKTSISINTWWR
jgi:hypothetical protein